MQEIDEMHKVHNSLALRNCIIRLWQPRSWWEKDGIGVGQILTSEPSLTSCAASNFFCQTRHILENKNYGTLVSSNGFFSHFQVLSYLNQHYSQKSVGKKMHLFVFYTRLRQKEGI